MKMRNGFVTNSSSSSFILTNYTKYIIGNEDWIRMWQDKVEEYCYDCGIPFVLEEWLDASHEIGDFLLGPMEEYEFTASNEDNERIELFLCYLYSDCYNGIDLSCNGRCE